jgi:hypothetical protein
MMRLGFRLSREIDLTCITILMRDPQDDNQEILRSSRGRGSLEYDSSKVSAVRIRFHKGKHKEER